MSGFQKQAMLRRAHNLGLDPVVENSDSESPEAPIEKFDILSCPNTGTSRDPISTPHIESNATQSETPKNSASSAEITAIFSIQETYIDTPSGLSFETFYAPANSPSAPLFICHHGAGSSAMSFWCLAKQLRKSATSEDFPGIFAFNARGHGQTPPADGNFTLSAFSADFKFVIREFMNRQHPENPICLVGHSLGGAVLTDFIESNPELDYDIKGLVLVDIVEETAVQSLTSMSVFLNKRPRVFASYAQAVQWHLQSRLLRNEESARVSVPELLKPLKEGGLEWRASLQDMSKFWNTWFSDLSNKFLTCSFKNHNLAKLLVLSSNESLDKALTIGQMQGKFQLIVFNNSTNAGHFLHEDIPQQVATSLAEFMRRLNNSGGDNRSRHIASLWGGKIHS